MAEPSLEQWRSLHEAAAVYRRRAPWQTFTDQDLFAVEDPETGEVGYCSVLGAGGQEFGLSVFPGREGLHCFIRLVLSEGDEPKLDTISSLRMIGLDYSDREVLEKYDLDVIRRLGLRFRGRGAWPWFRSLRPGYAPWRLEADEARHLEACLYQTIAVADAVDAGRLQLPNPLVGEPILVRRLREGEWGEELRSLAEPDAGDEEEAAVAGQELPVPDAERLQQLASRKARKRGVWMIGGGLVLVPITGDGSERPYYPLLFIAATDQGLVLTAEVLDPWSPEQRELDLLMGLLERLDIWPRQLALNSEALERLFKPIATALKIRSKVDDTSMLEALAADFLAFMTER